MAGAAGWPALDHLIVLTDEVGIFQHARYDVPNRAYGYCTDDVARALIVAVEAARRPATELVGSRLLTIYLAFLADAQLADGGFHNFMGFDRHWQDECGSADSLGRAVWGLGVTALRAPRESWRTLARELLERALPQVGTLGHLRSRAYAALGLARLAARDPHAPPWGGALRALVEPIATAYHDTAGPDWRWCEPLMTYDNARLCEALIRAGSALHEPALVRAGIEMLDFLAGVVVENGIFVPVGNDGWFPRGGTKARFSQQPLEAAAFVDAALAAHAATGEERYRGFARIGFDWYLGHNTAHLSLVVNGGCRDGIDERTVNVNMGAESTLAYLMSAISLAVAPARDLRLAQ